MIDTFAKSYEYVNGTCVVDGVVQANTEACTNVAGTAAWIIALIFIPLLIIGLAFFVLWVFMLIHAVKNEDLKDRTIWLAVLLGSFVLGSNWLAAIFYYFLAKRPYDQDKLANSTTTKPVQVQSDVNESKSPINTNKSTD